MRRDTFVAVRLSPSESARLEAMRAVLGCNRSEALRVLLRGVDAEGQHGNRMLPPARNEMKEAPCCPDRRRFLPQSALTNP